MSTTSISLCHTLTLYLFFGEKPLLSKTSIFSRGKKKIFFSSPLLSPPLTSIRERIEFNLLLGTINRRTNYIPPSPPPPPLCLSEMQFLNQDACYSRLKQVTRLYLLGCIAMGEERGKRGGRRRRRRARYAHMHVPDLIQLNVRRYTY